MVFAGILPLGSAPAGAAPVQTVGDLKARANQIAVDLDRLATKSSMLDESYNQAQIDLVALEKLTAGNQAELDAAEVNFRASTRRAKQYAVDAYVNGTPIDPVLMTSQTVAGASRRKIFTSVLQGDQQQVADDVSAAQQTLQDRRRTLNASNARATERSRQLADTKRSLEQTIATQQKVQDSVKGDLARAVADEQTRLESQRAAQAAADAQLQAQRAAQDLASRSAAAAAAIRAAIAAPTTPRSARSVPTTTTEVSGPGPNTETDLSQPGDAPSTTPNTTTGYPPAGPVPANIQTVIAAAKAQLGVPYRWGASSPGSGFDCSGLILYAYAQIGVSLPHSSRALHAMTQRISVDQLQPGDLIFGGSPVHHVGMYIGGGQQINAPHTGDVVKISPIYYVTPVSFGRL